MSLSARKEDLSFNAMTKSSWSFKTLPSELSSHLFQACLDQHRHFSPFVVSCDGNVGSTPSAARRSNSSKLLTLQEASPRDDSRKSFVFRNLKLYEIKYEHCDVIVRTKPHIYVCIRGSRTPTCTSAIGRWSLLTSD